jgi:CRISPR/Cas system Type II protein with McrA/HNH and RuvC-like nuclease domain
MSVGAGARFRVLRKCSFRCRYCGKPASETQLEIDHVLPKACGGTDHEDNLVAACGDCNRGKADDSAVEMCVEHVELPDGTFEWLYPDAAIRAALRELAE